MLDCSRGQLRQFRRHRQSERRRARGHPAAFSTRTTTREPGILQLNVHQRVGHDHLSRPGKPDGGASYWRGIRAGKMLTIAGSWFKSAGPRVGGGTHPGCTKSSATSRALKVVALPGRGGAGSAPGVRFARAGGRRARSSVPAAAMEKRMVASFWRPQTDITARHQPHCWSSSCVLAG